MAIQIAFKYGGDNIFVIIEGNVLMFLDANNNITTLDGLKISRSGVIEEFPDLKDDEDWKKKGLERLKQHIKKFDTETKKMMYIKDELNKYGYEALYFCKAGFRPKNFK